MKIRDMKKVLSIAGSDCSGGAGIQADLKTMCCLGVYGMSAITSMTAQNTVGVTAIQDATPGFLAAQLDSVFSDIIPDAVKTGMLSNAELVSCTADKLKEYGARKIVVDPVMVSTSGSRLLSEEAVTAAECELLPMATLITPNLPEAEVLSGLKITGKADMEKAALLLSDKYGSAVLVKGGHLEGAASDVLAESGQLAWFRSQRIDSHNTHGTGCTLSSAIACYLARGEKLESAVELAREYLQRALAAGLDLGRGHGPLAHNYMLISEEDHI
ncbi:MAG: bifunctional hydroxymethylpyrimidine kinase/phosphomethylpyrimidine kinase [Anaerovoracaceae bacterium]|jgi:hydroxymethylpyrimidine/phosphomethylpyrimidine kinase